jgi:hypothetical protein
MSSIRLITDKQSAYEFIVEQRMNSVSSEIDLIIFSQAECAAKIDAILSEQNYKNCLEQNQEIDLGLLSIRLKKQIDELKELSKKI